MWVYNPNTVLGVDPLWLVIAPIVFMVRRTKAYHGLVVLFDTFWHEQGHAVATVVTGGDCRGIKLEGSGNGVAMVPGGWHTAKLTAGYFGALLCGGVLIVFAARTAQDDYLSFFVGLAMISMTLLFVRNRVGIKIGLSIAAVLMAMGLFLPPQLTDFLLRFLGLACCIEAIMDIWRDGVRRLCGPRSDAQVMSRLWQVPVIVVGVIWFSAAAFIMYCILGVASSSAAGMY
jgi:hypothetical protein